MSRSIPPPIAVSMPDTAIARKSSPNMVNANIAPRMVKIPSPIASNFKNKFQCFFRRECSKKMAIAVANATITYVGSAIEFGKESLNSTSRIVPPATPVIIAKIIMPTMSALCSIALNAPVTANAIVPKISKMYMKNSTGKVKWSKYDYG